MRKTSSGGTSLTLQRLSTTSVRWWRSSLRRPSISSWRRNLCRIATRTSGWPFTNTSRGGWSRHSSGGGGAAFGRGGRGHSWAGIQSGDSSGDRPERARERGARPVQDRAGGHASARCVTREPASHPQRERASRAESRAARSDGGSLWGGSFHSSNHQTDEQKLEGREDARRFAA